MRQLSAILAASAAVLAMAPAVASAADITVDSNLDDGSGCTLREAIASANTGSASGCADGDAGGTDRIVFDAAHFPRGGAAETITLDGAEPHISSDVKIEGYGMNELTVTHGAGQGRLFFIEDMKTAEISGMRITGGEPGMTGDDSLGGALYVLGDVTLRDVCVCGNSVLASSAVDGVSVTATGGGIWGGSVEGITVIDSIVAGNTATATQTAASATNASATGGAIAFNHGEVTVIDSTVSANTAHASMSSATGTANVNGGAIVSVNGFLTVHGSTITGNVASSDSAGDALAMGGAIRFANGGPDAVELSTVAGNRVEAAAGGTATASGGGLAVSGVSDAFELISTTVARNGTSAALADGQNLTIGSSADNTVINSIIADPVGGGGNCDLAGPLDSTEFSDDYTPTPGHADTCGFAAGTGTTANPLLDPAGLADNGGPTQTIALLPGSPMIDAGSNAAQTTPEVDQRGLTRPIDIASFANAGNGTDIGAFELQSLPVVPPPPLVTPPGPTGLRAAALKKCRKKAKKRNKKGMSKKARKKAKRCRKKAKQLPL